MTTIDLTPIIQAVIALLAALVSYRLIPWLKARTTETQRANLETAIRIAVFAAEQVFGSGRGAEKMDYALNWLKEQGYEIDSREVEAAVAQLFNIPRVDNIIALMDTAEGEADE